MICPSCKREMERATVRYHTPNGYERKLVIYECDYDSCIEDFTEDEARIASLESRLREAEAVIKSGQTLVLKMYEVYDDPQYLAAFTLLHNHQGEYTGAKWTKEQDDFEASAAAFLAGGDTEV